MTVTDTSAAKKELLSRLLQKKGIRTAPAQRLAPRSESGPAPLSHAQRRLWLLDRLMGSSAEYNMPQALRLRGELDRDALGRAIDTIVARHESLRTHFAETDGEPVQIIAPELH